VVAAFFGWLLAVLLTVAAAALLIWLLGPFKGIAALLLLSGLIGWHGRLERIR